MCAKSCKACCKILIGAIVLIALVAAIAFTLWPQNPQVMGYLMRIGRFFDIMIPVLAVGALLKYLLCHRGCCCNCGDKKEESSSCCTHK